MKNILKLLKKIGFVSTFDSTSIKYFVYKPKYSDTKTYRIFMDRHYLSLELHDTGNNAFSKILSTNNIFDENLIIDNLKRTFKFEFRKILLQEILLNERN